VASPAHPLQSLPEVGRIEDRDPLDSTQRKEIGVSAHDIVRPPGDCTLEELVVARITAELECDSRLDELGVPAKEHQERTGSDWTGAELFKHVGTSQDVLDFSDDGFGQQENEAVATPSLVDPCSQALGAGKGAAQENLRVKNDSEPGQRGRPRRSQLQRRFQEDLPGLVHAR
jgi:hypothetical protein